MADFVKAAISALEVHTEMARIDTDPGDGTHSNSIAMYHLLCSLMDLAEKEGFSFSEMVYQVSVDRQDF